ncbi:hypothetical protein DLJ74_17570 [Gracilibacillus dipsosauri]|uniref:Uncharacterized protein n=1 Tax=Gracilibacillus dipsosauri TaxID=178340 RepID=A0A317KU09_9BACI|nr:hypothetical protein DLJ74_17570 [Gracilibacillus dipsosauri]
MKINSTTDVLIPILFFAIVIAVFAWKTQSITLFAIAIVSIAIVLFGEALQAYQSKNMLLFSQQLLRGLGLITLLVIFL